MSLWAKCWSSRLCPTQIGPDAGWHIRRALRYSSSQLLQPRSMTTKVDPSLMRNMAELWTDRDGCNTSCCISLCVSLILPAGERGSCDFAAKLAHSGDASADHCCLCQSPNGVLCSLSHCVQTAMLQVIRGGLQRCTQTTTGITLGKNKMLQLWVNISHQVRLSLLHSDYFWNAARGKCMFSDVHLCDFYLWRKCFIFF